MISVYTMTGDEYLDCQYELEPKYQTLSDCINDPDAGLFLKLILSDGMKAFVNIQNISAIVELPEKPKLKPVKNLF